MNNSFSYNPLVSVIIPNFNHAQFLHERFRTVVNQGYQNIEIILMDDVSSDNSIEILKGYEKHPKVKCLLLNEKNSGSTFYQWRKGLAQASGEIVWIAESDDSSDLSFLEKAILPLADETVVLSYVQSVDVDVDSNVIQHRLQYTDKFVPNIWNKDFIVNCHEFLSKYLFEFNVIPNASAVLFRKDLLERVITRDIQLEKYRKCGDWLAYNLICTTKNSKIAFNSEALNRFRMSPNNTRNMHENRQRVIRYAEELAIRSRFKNELGWTSREAILKVRLIEQILVKLSKHEGNINISRAIQSVYPRLVAQWTLVRLRLTIKKIIGRS
jgi:glycosyltransferase involved in cell wall biosynthesis